MTGMSRQAGFSRSFAQTSKPSMSGIVTSRSTRSGASCATARKASRPLVTGRASNPRVDRMPASNRRFSTVSSTRSTLARRELSGFDVVHLVECVEQSVILEIVSDPPDVIGGVRRIGSYSSRQLDQRSSASLERGLAELVGERSRNLLQDGPERDDAWA